MSKLDSLNKWLAIAQIFAPMVLATIPKAAKFAPMIAPVTAAIVTAEQIPGASGADKKAAVLSTLTASVAAANAAGAHLNADELAGIASQGIDLTIKVINDINALHVGTPVDVTPSAV